MRRSGVLLPVTSLPSRFGIGTFSKEAYAFVDFLKEAGQKLWQILSGIFYLCGQSLPDRS